ncbi:MAG: hypothetical protein J5913_08155 [Prevotella sp.]|nr:hypothetical protein [Prevotella sp.]
MKKIMTNIKTLAALLMAGAALTACSSEDNFMNDQPANPTEPKTYTMTIQASKTTGDDLQTRGLYWNNASTYDKIKVYWHEGEEVRVVQNGSVVGTLTSTASEDGETTLSGTLTGVTQDADLQFFLHADENCKMDYTGQNGGVVKQYDGDGNIEYNYDFAQATLTKTQFRLNTETGTITNMDNSVVEFTSNQAIVRFELFNSDGSANVYAKKLIISDANTGKIVKSIDGLTGVKTYGPLTYSPYAVTTGGQSCIFTMALNVGADATIVLDAIDKEGKVYAHTQSHVTFTPGKYYKVKANMTERTLKFIEQITPEDTYLKGWYVDQYAHVTKTYNASSCYAVVAYVGKVDHYFDRFIAIGLTNAKEDGTSGSEQMKWSKALTAAYNYDDKHHVYQISSTQSTNAYDAVSNDVDVSSLTATGDAQKGWRLPSVTDWRYIIEGLAGVSATNPVGIKGPMYDSQIQFPETLLETLNTYNLNLENVYYWSSSEVNANTNYAWYFLPNNRQTSVDPVVIDRRGFHYSDGVSTKEAKANRYVRPVFAY